MENKHISIYQIFTRDNYFLLKGILIIYIVSYIGATYNHLTDVLRYGVFPYQKLNQHVSLSLNIYWTLLTLADPLAIIILFLSIDIGLIIYGLIIISDVIINYAFIISNYGLFSWINFGQICQILFMFFYLFTVHYIHKEVKILKRNFT
jgi:hypothetical protein